MCLFIHFYTLQFNLGVYLVTNLQRIHPQYYRKEKSGRSLRLTTRLLESKPLFANLKILDVFNSMIYYSPSKLFLVVLS